MSLKCGIVGLPNVGKSNFGQLVLSNASSTEANFLPSVPIEPNVGVDFQFLMTADKEYVN